MKQLELFQQQLQRNQVSSFFEEGPPPITDLGRGGARMWQGGATRHFIPEESPPFEPVAREEADSQAFSHQQHLSHQVNSDWQGESKNRYVRKQNKFNTNSQKCILGRVWATAYKFKPVANSRPFEIFYKKLGNGDKRPLGTQYHFRVPNLFYKPAISEYNPINDSFSRAASGNRQRDRRNYSKTSHSICSTTSPQNKFSKYTVCGPQEGRRAKASV